MPKKKKEPKLPFWKVFGIPFIILNGFASYLYIFDFRNSLPTFMLITTISLLCAVIYKEIQ